MTAVFKSTTQALFVSFLMEVLPVTQKCSTQTLIEMLKAAAGIREDLSATERNVDFRGLTPMEVRGQCAMVVSACRDHLSVPERAAVHARFGLERRQAQGVRDLRDYLAPQLGGGSEWMHMALMWNLWGNHQLPRAQRQRRDEFSVRSISETYGIPKSTLWELQQKIKRNQRALENRAVSTLDVLFARTELVGFEPACA